MNSNGGKRDGDFGGGSNGGESIMSWRSGGVLGGPRRRLKSAPASGETGACICKRRRRRHGVGIAK